MRDLAQKWPAVPEWEGEAIERPGLVLRTVVGLDQLLVSGDVERMRDLHPAAAQTAGLLQLTSGDPYAVRVARDRILLVGSGLHGIHQGWHPEGLAVTRINAGLQVLEASGTRLQGLLQRAMTVDLAEPGPCAAVSFAGFAAVVYRYGDEGTLRVHVERALAPAMWTWMQSALSH
jgi:hypothetical protein